jgi:hypothetical protein
MPDHAATQPLRDGVVARWECRCQQPPVLLGTLDPGGQVNIKVRDRYWTASRPVSTRCPRCGTIHTLDPDPTLANAGG